MRETKCRETGLFAKVDDRVAYHVLLASRIGRVNIAGQRGACRLVNFCHIGFMMNFGYRYVVVMKFHSNKIVSSTADRLEHG